MTAYAIPTPGSIRLDYPQFKDIHIFEDRVINKYIALATTRLNAGRWGDLLGYGMELFTVHYLTMKERNDRVARVKGVPGEVKGPLTSRSVDSVSQSWDTKAVSLTDGAFWNATIYGIEFLQMARQIGMGGLQL